MRVLGIEVPTCGRAAGALKHSVIFPAPSKETFLKYFQNEQYSKDAF